MHRCSLFLARRYWALVAPAFSDRQPASPGELGGGLDGGLDGGLVPRISNGSCHLLAPPRGTQPEVAHCNSVVARSTKAPLPTNCPSSRRAASITLCQRPRLTGNVSRASSLSIAATRHRGPALALRTCDWSIASTARPVHERRFDGGRVTKQAVLRLYSAGHVDGEWGNVLTVSSLLSEGSERSGGSCTASPNGSTCHAPLSSQTGRAGALASAEPVKADGD